jgi:hypothetical protein
MKLLISWLREHGTYISREFHYIMKNLLQVHGWRHVEPWGLSQHEAAPKERLLDLFGAVPEVVLFWESYDLFNALAPALKHLGCRVDIFAADLHVPLECESMRDAKLRAFTDCDRVLANYADVFHSFYPELENRKQAIWIPHAASPDFILPFNDQPEDAILLSGRIAPIYPLRTRMKDLAKEGRFAIHRQEHPGYGEDFNYGNDPRVGIGYAATINRYRAAFTDASTYRYVVAKHFEIPATGALLVADGLVNASLRELGFIENMHYVAVSPQDLEEKIRYVLDRANSAEIDEIRRRGQELVLRAHRTCDRARAIDSVCVG